MRDTQNADDDVQAVVACREAQHRLVVIFRRQLGNLPRRHVGWVADNEVIAFAGQRLEQIRAQRPNAVLKLIAIDITARDRQGFRRNIRDIDSRLGKGQRTGNADTAAAGAQIQYPPQVLLPHPGREALFDQFGDR